jgi:thiamine biosynthesis protein ThiS
MILKRAGILNSGPFFIEKRRKTCYLKEFGTNPERRSEHMEILWNEARREIPDGTTVSGLLAERGLSPDAVVVELNGEICGVEETARILAAGDRLNVFRIVAGG